MIISKGCELDKDYCLNLRITVFFFLIHLHNLKIEWYNIVVSDLFVHIETHFKPQFDEDQLMFLFFRHFY